MKLRQDVFVVEQACAFGEIDGKDPTALHYFLLSPSGEIAGALRLFAGSGADRPSRIGRVVIAPEYRGQKLGQRLMRDGIDKHGQVRAGVYTMTGGGQSFSSTRNFTPTPCASGGGRGGGRGRRVPRGGR